MLEAWCDDHWDPVREGVEAREVNGVAATVLLIERAFDDDEVREQAEEYAVPGKKPGLQDLQWVIEEEGPLCCLLGDAAVEEVVDEARIDGGGA